MAIKPDKKKCCGCSACEQICPKHCINLLEDKEGFLYPIVDESKCVDCGLCENVCPELGISQVRVPEYVFATKNPNESIRIKSSSGGFFSLIAEKIINDGGVVFGARFDNNWNVFHTWTDQIEGIHNFRGSKYVQSRIGNVYKDVKKFIEQGRKVLFTGTPCQIAGLKKFLRKEHENLLTIEFICHGVPSPKIWRLYLESISAGNTNSISGIDFRDKSTGWKEYSFTYIKDGDKYTQPYYKNPYMLAFLSNLILRPSCYICPVKNGKSGSDITIGDFWGIEHLKSDFNDDKGISLIMFHNNKFRTYLDQSIITKIPYSDAIQYNQSYEKSVYRPLYRSWYFSKVNFKQKFYMPNLDKWYIIIIEKIYKKIFKDSNK